MAALGGARTDAGQANWALRGARSCAHGILTCGAGPKGRTIRAMCGEQERRTRWIFRPRRQDDGICGSDFKHERVSSSPPNSAETIPL